MSRPCAMQCLLEPARWAWCGQQGSGRYLPLWGWGAVGGRENGLGLAEVGLSDWFSSVPVRM